MYICESCHQELKPDDRVVAAAEQVEVTTQQSSGREYLDGVRSLFHEQHWPGNSARLKERARGSLSSVTSAG
jgi:hypothetical protein